jgi:uncharacterized protein (DUF58 family)
MQASLRGLTLRGRCVLAAGVAAGISGVILRERDLIRVAVLLVGLPLLAVGLAARTRFRLSCSRRLEPARLSAGGRARVVVRIENVSRLPTGLLLVEDTVPYLLGGRPRVVLDRLASYRPVDVGYQVSGEVRGRYPVGPLQVRLMDPFGMCELQRSFASVDTLVVTPPVVPLPAVRLTGEWAGAGQSTARSIATSGEDDAATREYRQGDDLRRIHWRTTARRGELTVRREEQPWQSRAALLLDGRAVAHRGDGPASSYEWAVSATASIGLHLSRSGFGIRLVTEGGDGVASAAMTGGAFDGALLDVLAVTRTSAGHSLHAVTAAMRSQGSEGVIIAVVGALTAADAEQLARLRGGNAAVGIVFLLDTASWATLAPRAATEAAQAYQRSRALLTHAGWRVVEVRRGDPLAELWAAVGQSVTATTRRDVVAATTGPEIPA